MANTFKFGNGKWAVKDGSVLAYNDENNNFKPLPFDFTRDSIATRVNKDGLIEVVPNNMPRIDFTDNTSGHLLLEPSRTNKITYSELLSNWTQDGTSTIDNNTISPDGTQNASKITFSSGSKRLVFTVSSTQAIYSAYFKGVSGTQIKLRNASGAIFNTITLTDEWVRYELDINASNGNVQIQSIDADYVYAWGVQLEDGSYPTSYIPTQGSSVTRVAETANDAGNSTVFNDSEGVLFLEIEALSNDLTYRGISIGDGTAANVVRIYYENVSNRFTANIKYAGVSQATMIYTFSDITINSKIAVKYKQNDFSLWINGTEVATDSSGSTPIGLDVLQFDTGTGGDDFYGKVKDLKVYNTALTDTELEKLTS